jgi:hypothetical protein
MSNASWDGASIGQGTNGKRKEQTMGLIDTYELRKKIRSENKEIPKTGKWIPFELDIGEVYPAPVFTCSACGDYEYVRAERCHWCGAEMEGGGETE